MLRSSLVPSLRHASLRLLLPSTLLLAACGDDSAANGRDGGANPDAAGTTDGAASPDTTPPTVLSNEPASSAMAQSIHTTVTATFSEPMAPLTLSNMTFTVTQGATAVAGAVTYVDNSVTFTPTSDLALDTTYVATITAAATDVAGNALAAAYSWSFKTDATAPVGPAPVRLGTAGGYAILAESAVSNVPTSVITGNLGLSPAAASYITGFSLTRAGTKWTSPQVVGSVFAADSDPPTPINLTTAVGNMETAYTDAAGRPTPTSLDLGAGTIGGLTLTPGLYRWNSAVTIPTDITISGAPNDTWIFQITGDLTMASAKKMTLSGGARARNIVWQVAGAVDIGTTAHAEGIVLGKTAITLGTGASINGRLLAQTAVNLDSNAVTAPAP